jgi:hypothetical protein
MLRRKLQDWFSGFSIYHKRLKLTDLTIGQEVMVMQRVNFWGKTDYEFTGIIIAATEDTVIIRNKDGLVSGIGQGLTAPASMFGLIDDSESFMFLLEPTIHNRLNVYL